MHQQGGGAAGRAPGQGADAGAQFIEVDRLDEVIVGPGIEAGYLVAGCVAGGQDQNGQALAAVAGAFEHFHAAQARQAKVEHDEIEAFVAQAWSAA
jgi:D-alanyl-D-alanine carboxypeptidase/D-alanyl-D-alanine-endopeptidase (penicillin-binding protein 4)